MRNLILAALLAAIPATAFAEPAVEPNQKDNIAVAIEQQERIANLSKFQAYKERMAARRAAALETRRAYNASKGPHVYRTAVAVNLRPFIAIEHFWVKQPPIPVPVRPVVGLGYVAY